MAIKLNRRFLFVVALVLLGLGLLLVLRSPAPGLAYQALLEQGDAHAADLQRSAAAAAYGEAVELRPDDPTAYVRLVQLYLEWGRVDDALATLEEAERLPAAQTIELEQLWVGAYTARADWSAVVEHAHRLLVATPEDRETRHTLARAYTEQRAWHMAQTEYETLLATDADDVVAHERLGILLLGDSAEAIRHLSIARTDLAQRLLESQQTPGAADDVAFAAASAGRVLFAADEWALAVCLFDRTLAHNAAYADVHAYLGYALDQMGYPDEAAAHLEQAVALDPESVLTHFFLGNHHDRLGDHTTARAAYETAYDLDPHNPAMAVAIGQTWAREGNFAVAEIWLTHAVDLQPNDAGLWKVLARFYLDHTMVSRSRAISATNKLVELSPEDAAAYDLRGWAALQAGDYDTAQRDLERAVRLDPTFARAHYHLGVLWHALGQAEEAQAAFTRTVDLDTSGDLLPLVERMR